jgi:hypothetical protein
MPFNSNCIIINFTFINMLLRWFQQQELIDEQMTWWLMKIGLEKGLLRLESSMHILGFFGINNGIEFMFFHFLDILKSFDRCDICINTYKFCLIAIVTSCLYYVCMP